MLDRGNEQGEPVTSAALPEHAAMENSESHCISLSYLPCRSERNADVRISFAVHVDGVKVNLPQLSLDFTLLAHLLRILLLPCVDAVNSCSSRRLLTLHRIRIYLSL